MSDMEKTEKQWKSLLHVVNSVKPLNFAILSF